MQCQCGGNASSSKAAMSSPKCVLKFIECSDCKRVSDGVLYIKDIVVARDSGAAPKARDAFRSMTDELAKELLETVKRVQVTPPPEPLRERQNPQPLDHGAARPAPKPVAPVLEQGELF